MLEQHRDKNNYKESPNAANQKKKKKCLSDSQEWKHPKMKNAKPGLALVTALCRLGVVGRKTWAR